MTKNTTKRALVMSMISMLLCVSMLVGSTFAWFTDTASTGVNKITSGNLDMVVSWYNGSEWSEIDSNTKLFKEGAEWEPGYTEVAYIKVENAGSLAFKYQFSVNVTEEVKGISVTGKEIILSKVLKFDAIEIEADAFYETREEAVEAVEATAGDLATKVISGELLNTNDVKYYAMVVYMPEEIGNDANHNGTDVPSVNFGVTASATQYTKEQDSYDDQYDKDVEIFGTEAFILTKDHAGKALVGNGSTVISTVYRIDGNKVENCVITSKDASQVNGDNEFNNCTFTDLFWLDDVASGSTVTFNNCTFDHCVKFGGNETVKYVFNNCSFSGKVNWSKALLTTYAPTELNNCTFDYSDGAKYSVRLAEGLDIDDVVATGSTEAIVQQFNKEVYFINEQGSTRGGAVTTYDELTAAIDAGYPVQLMGDIVVPIAQYDVYWGTSETTEININGNGHTITFKNDLEQTRIYTVNPNAVLNISNAAIGRANPTVGNYLTFLSFYCNTNLTEVKSAESINLWGVAKTYNLTGVEIIDERTAAQHYAMFIKSGNTVTIDGCIFDNNAGTGRGIKVSDVNSTEEEAKTVTNLTVMNTSFASNKKSAILVGTKYGANVTLENVNISAVEADSVNAVWVEDVYASYVDDTVVTGGTKVIEQ